MVSRKFRIILAASLAFVLVSCQKEDKRTLEETKEKVEKNVQEVGKEIDTAVKKLDTLVRGDTTGPVYVCKLNPTQGSEVRGTLTIWQRGDKVHIKGDVSGLAPGKHGFHIHEKGDCSAADASSAGAHFNPTGKEHGPMGKESHLGDFGNIEAGKLGVARVYLELDAEHWKLTGPNSIVGKSIVVHEKEDDLKTQPTGNSGARLACGVIEKQK